MARRGPAAAVGKVEGGELQIEEAVILAQRGGDRPGECALALGEAGVEAGIAVRIGADGGEHLVVAGDQAQLGIGERRHRRRTARGRRAGEAGQAEIGDDEPLRRAGRAVVARTPSPSVRLRRPAARSLAAMTLTPGWSLPTLPAPRKAMTRL